MNQEDLGSDKIQVEITTKKPIPPITDVERPASEQRHKFRPIFQAHLCLIALLYILCVLRKIRPNLIN